jgi:hypothetical protein
MLLPVHFRRVYKFLLESSSHIKRDFRDIIAMNNSDHFAHKTKSYFESKIRFYLEDGTSDKYIFIDGFDNFKNGINLWTIVSIQPEHILIYDVVNDIFYWDYELILLCNGKKLERLVDKQWSNNILLDNSLIPMSLQLIYLSTGLIESIEYNSLDERWLSSSFIRKAFQLKENRLYKG